MLLRNVEITAKETAHCVEDDSLQEVEIMVKGG